MQWSRVVLQQITVHCLINIKFDSPALEGLVPMTKAYRQDINVVFLFYST